MTTNFSMTSSEPRLCTGGNSAGRLILAVLFAVTCGPFSAGLLAHGDLHAQITAATARINRDPRNPVLYVERGGLYRAHREWRLALADCDRALRLAPGLGDARLCRGLTLADAGRHSAAERELTTLLERHPDLVVARVARARVFVSLRRPLDADPDYAAALARHPNPDWYLERAHALQQAGDPRAVRVLDEAIEKLGPLVTLEDYAIELDLAEARYESALTRIDRVLGQLSRAPSWLVRRGAVLERFKRPADARQAYVEALEAIEALPPARRRTRAIEDVMARARTGLVRTVPPASPQ